jgi:hypothetical protein
MLPGTKERLEVHRSRFKEAATKEIPRIPEPARFEPKYDLPILEDYSLAKFPASYWSKWKKRSLNMLMPGSSWVSSEGLRDLAARANFPHTTMLNRVCDRLDNGANIGCEGRGRLPTFGSNAKTVYEYGDRVSDSLQGWICEGIAAGPLRLEELAVLPAPFTVNPMGAKLKPNGKIRVLVNASSPHDEDDWTPGWIWSPKLPGSVNSTIDPAKFPTKMSSVPRFVRALSKCGRNAQVDKLDYKSAYKHQHVAEEDLPLQVIKWGDRYFVEMKLMFGSRSSPGIFDELAKVFLWCCETLAGIPRYLVEQHIDDVLGAGPPGADSVIWKFHQTYLKEARNVGIQLDDSGNSEKQQEPSCTVVALGVCFNTSTWTWGFKPDRLAIVLNSLNVVRSSDYIEERVIQSLTGKLVDVRSLVPGGRYNLLYFLRAVHKQERTAGGVEVGEKLKEQAQWWVQALIAANEHSLITHPDVQIPANAREAWTDAAGGTSSHMGAGLGVITPALHWAYMPWPTWLNNGGCNSSGVKFANKLSCLEMLGPLVALCTEGERIMSEVLIVYVDNQGAVDIYRKGHSTTCVYTSTVAKACHDLAWSLGCTLVVQKVRRCSDGGSLIADMISKGDLAEFRKLVPNRRMPAVIPVTLIDWIKDPVEDLHLGFRMAEELSSRWRDVVPMQ